MLCESFLCHMMLSIALNERIEIFVTFLVFKRLSIRFKASVMHDTHLFIRAFYSLKFSFNNKLNLIALRVGQILSFVRY